MGFRDGIHKDVKGGLRRDRAQHTNAALAAGPARRETPAANVQSSERNLQRKEFTKQQKATATVSSGVGVQQAKTEPAKRSRAGAARGCRRLGRHSNEHNSWERASSRWEQSCERQTPSWKAEDAQPREPGKVRHRRGGIGGAAGKEERAASPGNSSDSSGGSGQTQTGWRNNQPGARNQNLVACPCKISSGTIQ
ncbi:uncharacterized protein LOC119712232 isoform X3 [Motacilla alba alba]|uniref:uncharacterized protein LOC119712232 isoform X3 n=1 Tax=Motacilla alba alba TaxID=1094192 RepID=UPI0018D5632F|nr:uncharacterized protein LOC119712232 isoform X3 [Motacilla alba alba]